MKLFLRITQRLVIFAVAMTLTIAEQVATAVALPETLRSLQQFMSWILSAAEYHFSIAPQYMVWVEMAGIDEKLVFMSFYFGNLFLLYYAWLLTKRLWRRLSSKKPAPAAA